MVVAAVVTAVVSLAPRIRAHAQDCGGGDGLVSFSRLWTAAPSPVGAGWAGAERRGWNDDKTVRPGRGVDEGDFGASPWLFPEGEDGGLNVRLAEELGLNVRLAEELGLGPMLGTNVDAEALLSRFPITRPRDLIGGERRYVQRARAEAWGALVPRCLYFWVEAADERDAATALGAGREERATAPRVALQLSFQPSPSARLTLGGRFDALMVDDAGLSSLDLPSAGRDRRADEATVVASWRQQWTARSETTVIWDLTLGRDDWQAANGLGAPGHLNLDNDLGWGNTPFSRRARERRQRLDLRWSGFADGLLADADAHTVTAGLQLELADRDDDETRNGGFTFSDALPRDEGGMPVDVFAEDDRQTWLLFSSDRGDELHAKTRRTGLALYLEDRFQLGSSLTIVPGARAEWFGGGFREVGGAGVWRSFAFQPRLAVDWEPGEHKRTSLYLRGGRHAQRLSPSMFVRERSGAAFSPLEYWDWSGDPLAAAEPAIDDPRWTRARAFEPFLGEVAADVAHPVVDRVVVGVIHRFPAEVVTLGLRWELRRYADMVGIVDRGFAEGLYQPRTVSLSDAPADRFDYFERGAGTPSYVIGNPAGARRTYQQLRLTAAGELFRWLYLRGSLAWSIDRGNLDSFGGLSEEWRDPSGTVRAYGNLPGVDRYAAHAEAAVDLPLGVRAWIDYSFFSGRPYSRQLRVQPANAPRVYVFDPAGRGGYTLPARHLIDARLQRDLPLPGPGFWQAYLQVNNLLNADTVTGFRETTSSFRGVRRLESPFEVLMGVRYEY